MTAQSTVFPLFVRAEYEAGQAFSRFESEAKRAASRVKQEFQAVGQTLDQALTAERNAAGALDLGVDELRQAAAAQQQRAIAAREVADASLRAAQADGKFNAQMRAGVTAARQYATEQERLALELQQQVTVQEAVQRELNQTTSATEGLIAAQKRGTTARGSVINSTRAERTAFIQLGQQLQDVTIQTQLGTSAFQIFAQQMPQAAFALTGLEGSLNKTKDRIGQVATFLSGPWGAAIFAATAVLGPYIAGLFDSGDAADESARANRELSEVLEDQTSTVEEVTEALQEYIRTKQRDREITLLTLETEARSIASKLREAAATREQIAAQLELQASREFDGSEATGPGGFTTAVQAVRVGALRERLAANRAEIDNLVAAADQATVAIASGLAEVRSDREVEIKLGFDALRKEATDASLGVEALTERLAELNKAERAALDELRKKKSNGATGSIDKELRAAERLAEFGRDAADRIAGIRDQYSQLPPEIARVNNATRRLNDLITDLEFRKPEGFRDLVNDAEDLRDSLLDLALDRTLDDIIAVTQEQLALDRLILAGRDEEADIMREMLRLEDRFGESAEDRRAEIEDIVRARRAEEEVLQRLQDLQNGYLGATRSFRQEIENLLSGENVDFGRIFRRLRGQYLTEQIFGSALRRIEATVKGSFDRSADTLERNVDRAGRSFDEVAQEAEVLSRRLSLVMPDSSAPAGRPTPSTSPALAAQFDALFGGAGAVSAANDNEIVVSGKAFKEAQRNTVTGMTPEDYALLVGKELTSPLLAQLPPEIAEALSPVLSRAVGGLLTAGPVGGVLGGLDGLFGVDGAISLGGKLGASISKGISGAFGGAQIGSLTSTVLDSIGIGNSNTGSTIGGAVGSIFSPAGSVIGSILGGLVGNLFGSKSGSATLGAGANGLGVIGTGGGSGSRRDAAMELAGTITDTINRLAEQLGATVDASAATLSVGVRKDDFRLDTTGSGATRLSNGAINFGSDGEALVSAAVQDLIQDGVIDGLTQSESNLIKATSDIDQAVADVLTFRSVKDRLNGLENPVEQDLIALNREFSDLIDLFDRANATIEERAELERLYELERARLIEEATDRVAGSLKSLIEDLETGDNGLSLRARRENAVADFDELRARVEAGDTSAIDDFEQTARTLLAIERQIFGSQERYFDRLDQVLSISNEALKEQESRIESSASAGNPFNASSTINDPIGLPIAEQTAELGSKLDAVNVNLKTLISLDQRLTTISKQLERGSGGFSRSLAF